MESQPLIAAQPGFDQGLIQSTGFHVCISTSNFERSIGFYRALGFSAEGQIAIERESMRMQYLHYPACNAVVEIICHQDRVQHDRPALARKDILGLNHFGFHVNDIGRVREALILLGAPIIEDSSRGVYDFIFAQGPDGELVSFAEFKNSQRAAMRDWADQNDR
ncbi:MAG: VOC family protein [Synechococcaceae cyanobacterium]|nr:VOC family protein [Synechococcaceae cyanobacterium]